MFWNCLYVLHSSRVRTKDFSEQVYILRKIRLLDDGVRPNCAEQLILLKDPATVGDKQEKQVKCLRLQLNRLAITKQHSLTRINSKRAELEERLFGASGNHLENFLRKN